MREGKIPRLCLLISLISLLGLLGGRRPAHAQTFSLSITPPLLEVLIKPGKIITQTYQVGNLSDRDIELVANVVPFKASGDEGDINLILDKGFFDKSINWFSLQNANRELGQSFTIPGGKTEQLVLKIRVPADAEEKDYYYTLIVRNLSTLLTTGQTRTVAGGILGSHILLAVSQTGELPQDLEVSRFELARPFILKNLADSFEPVAFRAAVKNRTRHFLKTEGKITVKANQNQVVSEMELMPVNVLAFGNRQAVCRDSVDCTLNRRLVFGRYQAQLSLDTAQGKTEKSFIFYVLPVRAGAVLIGGLVLVLIFFFLQHRVLILDKTNTRC